MYKADSEIIGIIWGLLAFGLPLIVSFFERKKKKKADGQIEQNDVVVDDDNALSELFKAKESVWDEIFDFKSVMAGKDEKEEEVVEVEVKPEVEIKPKVEVKPVTVTVPVTQVTGKVEQPVGEEEKLKVDPKKLVLYSEIMNPKFKEY